MAVAGGASVLSALAIRFMGIDGTAVGERVSLRLPEGVTANHGGAISRDSGVNRG